MFNAIKFYALAVVFLLSVVDLTSASSKRIGRIKRLAHPSTLSLEILPRHRISAIPLSSYDKRQLLTPRSNTLRYSDSFRLIISAFDDTFHLHLRPNDHLIHPAARITYHTLDSDGRSSVAHSEPLLRESVKAYWGEVIHGDDSNARLREDAAGVIPRPSRSSSELGWARIMVHHQGNIEEGVAPIYEGAFSYKGVVHHIMTKDNYLRNRHHLDPEILVETVDSNLVVWRNSDLIPHEENQSSPAMCGHDNLPFNTDPVLNPVLQKPFAGQSISLGPFGNFSLSKRDDVAGSGSSYNFEGTIGNNAGCPTTQKLLYMGVAADCKYVSNYGGSMNATTQILMNWNSASALYKSTFNVSLGIIEVQVQNETCPTTADSAVPWNVDCTNVDLNDRLSLFSEWRGQRGNDSIGLWHLMSGCPTGTEVGIAWLGTLCQTDASGSTGSVSSGTGVSTNGLTEWQVVSHEIGHNFGAIHDCTDGCNSTTICCPSSSSTCNANSQFIMNPVTQSSEKIFSACSLGNICSLMSGSTSGGKTDTSCLVDASANTRSLLSLQMCGNGIVEDGEDCDPGNGVSSPCCDSSTCKFTSGSQCDPSSSACCTSQCDFAPSTQVCRPSKNATCDPAEYCTGSSSACPTDIVEPNGMSCGSNGLACASGQCTSLSLQCQTVGASMGLTTGCSNHQDTCQITCQDPTNSNSCIQLASLVVDGSPCGYGGTCSSGNCRPGSVLDIVKAWYSANLQIAIPVTVVGGIVILLLIYVSVTACRRCYVRRKLRNAPMVGANVASGPSMRHQRLTSNDSASAPLRAPSVRRPPAVDRENAWRPINRAAKSSGRRSKWIDESQYNGPRPS
ncbi:Metallo-peptidase family M12-domain-containing protein [Lentinula detonsa]|uniref:Disintegrin and metalloproteinase domain-containing protein B n=1 Tax=Lentinula detonsa TaxID=2804962 RepID=A0A9W8U3N6_9AGAR|nr:Metallo-peptidase family M12-domain-containing protein [Lentinula detonsa]